MKFAKFLKKAYEDASKRPIITFITEIVIIAVMFFAGLLTGSHANNTTAKADTIEFTESYEYSLTGKLQGIRLYQSTTISASYAEIMSDILIKYTDNGIISVSRSTYNIADGTINYIDVPTLNLTTNEYGETIVNVTVVAKVYTSSTSSGSVTTIPLTLSLYNQRNSGRNTPTQFYSLQGFASTPTYAEYNSDITQSGVWLAKFSCRYYEDTTSHTGYVDKQLIYVYVQNQTYMNYKYYLNKVNQEQTISFGNFPKQTYTQGYNEGYINGRNSVNTDAIYQSGYTDGFAAATTQGSSNDFLGLVGAIVNVPVNIAKGLFNFEFLGYNMQNVMLSILTIFTFVAIIRFILGHTGDGGGDKK